MIPLKIAQIAPLFESVPPKYYGGTERVVSYLTEELVKQGHDVTLYASGDSVTQARLIAPCSRSLRLDDKTVDHLSRHILMIEWLRQHAQDYDVVHSHIDYLPFSVYRRFPKPVLSTLHGRLDLPELQDVFNEFQDAPVASISMAQREPLSQARWVGNVYHGLPEDLYSFHPRRGEYLAFLGRISPEKRVDVAIEIAVTAGIPLKIAAKVDKVDAEYFKTVVAPLLQHPLIEFVGEIGDKDKNDFLGNALALLFPIDWPEPFGLVMIEAMACGTPVIAKRRGSVAEVMEEGITGFICEEVTEAVTAIKRFETFDRRLCRQVFERRFSARVMVRDYLAIYRELMTQGKEL